MSAYNQRKAVVPVTIAEVDADQGLGMPGGPSLSQLLSPLPQGLAPD